MIFFEKVELFNEGTHKFIKYMSTVSLSQGSLAVFPGL